MATNIEMDRERVSQAHGVKCHGVYILGANTVEQIECLKYWLRKGCLDQALREGRDEGEAGIENVPTS